MLVLDVWPLVRAEAVLWLIRQAVVCVCVECCASMC